MRLDPRRGAARSGPAQGPGAPGVTSAAAHLTYCTNIHPGESWADVRASLETHVVAVKAAVAPDRPFGVGLRLGATALAGLASPEEAAWLEAFLVEKGLYVFTLNGFPYGAFHGAPVKTGVYRPDWREPARLDYTDALADRLATLLPPGAFGSVSTVPGCFQERAVPGAEEAMRRAILAHAAHLVELERRCGRTIALALEPEPHCLLETTSDAVAFFERWLFGREACAELARLTGLAAADAEAAVHRHVGVCFDACHAAVEFEDARTAMGSLAAAGIRIAKIQLSAGLEVERADREAREALRPFAEGVYLHQVVARSPSGELRRYLDLPEAIAAADRSPERDQDSWRVHFHVPIFRSRLGRFGNTQPFLAEVCALHAERALTEHLEVETYTWDVLPEEFRGEPVVSAIARELAWAEARL
jgi:sugar phosphate isomerase/epimerase